VRLRQPQPYCEVGDFFEKECQAVPEVQTGSREVDAALRVEADDPAVARTIAAHLVPFASMPYVHVVGDAAGVAFDMAHPIQALHATTLATGYGFHFIDPILHALACIACAVDGRPIPGELAPPTTASTVVPAQA
jgi:hypothetical protein